MQSLLWSTSVHGHRAQFSKRWSAHAISLALHLAVIGLLALVDLPQQDPVDASRYRMVTIPEETHDQIIWYKASRPLPDIASKERFGPLDKPAGDETGPVLISRSPNPVSHRQTIRQPDHPQLLLKDLPAPNLVTLQTELQAPTKPLPKAFIPPPPVPAKPKAQLAPVQIDAPRLEADPESLSGKNVGALLSSTKLPSRLFVPPAAHPNSNAQVRLAPLVPDSAPPVSGFQMAPASGLETVLAGLNPAAASPPQESREGQFARAPALGVPSSGATPPGMTTVPNLVSRGTPVAPSGASGSAPDHSVSKEYREVVLPGVNRTMSAPLRPSSRIIPPSVEALFSNRNVYTLVIPNPGSADYSGDWVMWFGERVASEGESPRISAPIPSRKYFRVDAAGSSPVKASFQFAAMIDRAGRLTGTRVLRGSVAPELRREAMADLGAWEFKPALRNGEPIEVDVVLDIPFQLRVETASGQ